MHTIVKYIIIIASSTHNKKGQNAVLKQLVHIYTIASTCMKSVDNMVVFTTYNSPYLHIEKKNPG